MSDKRIANPSNGGPLKPLEVEIDGVPYEHGCRPELNAPKDATEWECPCGRAFRVVREQSRRGDRTYGVWEQVEE